jgi:Uma2 family endonuclease
MVTAIDDPDALALARLDPDAAKFYEVVEGQIVENPPMGARESILASFLQDLMGPFARSSRMGRVVTETLFLLDHSRKLKRRPDLAFVSAKRWSLKRSVPETESWHVVPDLAVEVISKTNTAYAVAKKIEDYFEAGVTVVWVIYPATSKIYVYGSPTRTRILELGDDLDGGEIIPGFSVPLSTLFGRKKKSKRQPKAE